MIAVPAMKSAFPGFKRGDCLIICTSRLQSTAPATKCEHARSQAARLTRNLLRHVRKALRLPQNLLHLPRNLQMKDHKTLHLPHHAICISRLTSRSSASAFRDKSTSKGKTDMPKRSFRTILSLDCENKPHVTAPATKSEHPKHHHQVQSAPPPTKLHIEVKPLRSPL